VAGFVKGDVVVVPFPFSDLTQAKRRPALVLAALPGDDLILCQITAQVRDDPFAIQLLDKATFGQPRCGRSSMRFVALSAGSPRTFLESLP
jgi:hypothetical protein